LGAQNHFRKFNERVHKKNIKTRKISSLMYLQRNNIIQSPLPSSTLARSPAIKYVDFSVYILACVPYLVGKQNAVSRRSSQQKKEETFEHYK
jgi:hypothetical protein